jgi:glutamate racemase
VLGVIEPGATAARAASRSGDVLVIATDATVQSHAYATACNGRGLRALEKACPLLVPLVEEGWTNHPVTEQVVRIYLDELIAESVTRGLTADTLVLGCTHYPLLRPVIERAVPSGMKVIDSAAAAADSAARLINNSNGKNDAAEGSQHANGGAPSSLVRCFATDSVEKFERLGSRFLGHTVGNVELVDLGG